jgi:hypothetical protein
MEPIVLTECQEVHYGELDRILDTTKFAISTAMLGSGKTYVAAVVALRRKFAHVVTVSPVSVIDKHTLMKEKHGVPVVTSVSYASLRSSRGRQPKHGLLKRRDFTEEQENRTIRKVEFEATAEYRRMVEEGLLLVIDEVQNVKNVTEQFHSVRALVAPVSGASPKCASRVVLLSGSPIDKEEQAVTLFRVLGVMKENRLSTYDLKSRSKIMLGADEIVGYCRTLDREVTDAAAKKCGKESGKSESGKRGGCVTDSSRTSS